jgi:hypothetical protein
MKTNRSEAVIAANGKVANRYLLCSVTGRAARSFQVAGKLSSQAITEALHMVGEGDVIRPQAVKHNLILAA